MSHIRNLIRWLPIIWSDKNWDWVYLAKILEFKLRLMEQNFRKYGHHADSDRDARTMLICAELLKRLQADDPDDLTPMFGEVHGFVIHVQRMTEWEQMLGRYLGKNLRRWWD